MQHETIHANFTVGGLGPLFPQSFGRRGGGSGFVLLYFMFAQFLIV